MVHGGRRPRGHSSLLQSEGLGVAKGSPPWRDGNEMSRAPHSRVGVKKRRNGVCSMQTRLCMQGPEGDGTSAGCWMSVGPGSDDGAGLMSRRARQGQTLRLSSCIECEKPLSCVSDGVAEWTCILFIYYFYFCLFSNCCLHWVFVAVHGLFIAMHGLSLVVASGGNSSLQGTGFTLRQLLLLQSTGSRACGLQWL